MSDHEPNYAVGDCYATVESEAFDRAGEPIILVRLVHPPQLVHTHLQSMRPMPYTLMSLHELINKIDEEESKRTGGRRRMSVHLVGDQPELNNFPRLLKVLWNHGHKILLNSYGTLSMSEEDYKLITSLYVIAKPGLYPTPQALYHAKEVRCYIRNWGTDGGHDEFAHMMDWLIAQPEVYPKLFAMPFTLDSNCVKRTIEFCLLNGIRAQIPLCRVWNLDEEFMGPNGMAVVNNFHIQDQKPATSETDPYPRGDGLGYTEIDAMPRNL